MSFTIDNQTLKDLNIFDESSNSVFNMFKSTRTIGARERLREMMLKPVKDAFDASLLIISELSFIKSSAFFISTHIVELAEELKIYENISFRCLDTFFKDGKPVFTYKLTQGVSKERLGMFIVLNEGIVEVIRQAAGKRFH